MNNQILVIGGAGYIGSHVVLEFLSKGYQVTVLDNLSSGREENLFPNVEFIHGDIQDRNLLTKVFQTHYDGVVHLAALKAAGESMFIPETYSHQNITGTLNILEAMVPSKTRNFIFSSTAAVYGPPQYLPMDEKHPVEPINFYGFTKLEIEHFLKWFDQLKGIKFAALRYFNAAGYDVQGRVQGLEKQPANLIPVVMETASGFRQSMQIFGNDYETKDGSGVRDYVHVSDLANAHVLAFEHLNIKKESTTINLGTGKGYSVLEVIQETEKVSGKKVNYQVVEKREGDPAGLYASYEKAKEVLNWEPRFSDLHTLIESTWNIYQIKNK